MTTETMQFEMNETAGFQSEADGAAPNAQEGVISLFDMLIVLAERKRFIFKVTAAFALLAVVISFVLPTRYSATATILTPQQPSSMAAALSAQLGNLGGMAALAGGSGLSLKNPNDLYVGMLTSRTVEDAMVQHFNLMGEYHKSHLSDARKVLQKHTSIDGSGKDGEIHIIIEDRDPQRAAQLANGYVDQFRSLSQRLAITEASQRRLFFEQELELAKNKLADAEEAMKQTEQSTGMIEVNSQAKALIDSAAILRAQIATKEVQIQGMETYATGENAQLVQSRRELDGMRAQLAKLGGSEDSGSAGFIIPKGMVPEASLETIRKMRDVKYYETIFEILARQFEAAKLDEAKQGAVIQVVDPAIAPDRRSSPRRGLIVIGATILGFFFAIFTALFQAFFENLKSTPKTNAKLTVLRKALSIRG
ncbi:MAG: Wzz/FepE/Etk N-terminal domain-containing protein [Terracidiphilus sp.]